MSAKNCILLFALTLFASAAFAQTPVVVTNRAGDAVPVKVVNDPAKRSYHAGVDLAFPFTGEYPTVPAGKMFVVEYITGTFRTFNAFGAATCKPYEIQFSLRPDNTSALENYAVLPTHMGTGQGISGDVNFYSITQPVAISIAPGTPIAPAWSLGPVCSAPTVQGRIVFSGYLVKAN